MEGRHSVPRLQLRPAYSPTETALSHSGGGKQSSLHLTCTSIVSEDNSLLAGRGQESGGTGTPILMFAGGEENALEAVVLSS